MIMIMIMMRCFSSPGTSVDKEGEGGQVTLFPRLPPPCRCCSSSSPRPFLWR